MSGNKQEMSKRERVEAALNLQETDRTPVYDILLNDAAIDFFTGQFPPVGEEGLKLRLQATAKMLDMTRMALASPREPGEVTDEDGFVYYREDRWISGGIKKRPFHDVEGARRWVAKRVHPLKKGKVMRGLAAVALKEYDPVPLKEYTPAPVKDYTPVPLKDYSPTPLKPYRPKPLKSYRSKPLKDYRPKPLKAYVPKPIKDYAPVPIKPYTPKPLKDYVPTGSGKGQDWSKVPKGMTRSKEKCPYCGEYITLPTTGKMMLCKHCRNKVRFVPS